MSGVRSGVSDSTHPFDEPRYVGNPTQFTLFVSVIEKLSISALEAAHDLLFP